MYQSLVQGAQLRRVYLNELTFPPGAPLAQHILQLVVSPEPQARAQLPQLREEVAAVPNWGDRLQIVELVQKILVYKFNTLSREEIERMFAMEELKNTRYFRELAAECREQGLQEGLQQGRAQGGRIVVMQLIRRWLGGVHPDLEAQLQNLSLEQLEALSLALLDFETEGDLQAWLAKYGN